MARAATAAGAATQTRVAVGSERSSRKTAFLDDRFVKVVKNDAEKPHYSKIGFATCARTTLSMKSKSQESNSVQVALRARYYCLTGRGAIEENAQSTLAFVGWSQIPGFS